MAEQSHTAAIVIVNFGSSDLLRTHAATITFPEASLVVVVDCFSHLAERQRVAEICAERGWFALLLEENRGFGGGVNAGAEFGIERGADVVVTINPDATIDHDSLNRLIATAGKQRDALVSPRIVTGEGSPWFDGADLYLDDGTSARRSRREERPGRPRREWATGACFALSADLWARVGGFDDDYFLYWEDIDLSHRILDAGGRLVLLESATAVHDEGQTHGRAAADRAKSETYYYFNIRNRLLYAAKHLDEASVQRWLRSSRIVSYGILLQGGRRQLFTSLAPWRAYRRGLRDGRKLLTERHRSRD
jgi:GT2 family glycosyltransferase